MWCLTTKRTVFNCWYCVSRLYWFITIIFYQRGTLYKVLVMSLKRSISTKLIWAIKCYFLVLCGETVKYCVTQLWKNIAQIFIITYWAYWAIPPLLISINHQQCTIFYIFFVLLMYNKLFVIIYLNNHVIFIVFIRKTCFNLLFNQTKALIDFLSRNTKPSIIL